MKIRNAVTALVVVVLCACSGSDPAPASDQSQAAAPGATPATSLVVGRDYHSYARPDRARIRHVGLDLAVDFERRVLSGYADLSVDVSDASATELILDTRDLGIESVAGYRGQDGVGAGLDFHLGATDADLGTPLHITLPPGSGNVQLRIAYSTSPAASGLQWLSPPQTAGKKYPFLFTQSQAIHARSWIPLQDTPAVRVTYNATIRTAPELLATMSAVNDHATERDGVYEFDMPQPIPSYLIALGVGNLVFEPMSDRTGVYAEPELVAAAAYEFADTESMMKVSESLFGPYRWGRYDLLILPPSFPFGGMENPRLSFITPTVIAGDRSLVGLIAHELAHSWSGNLVTNATWRDLWLNEGFTSYLTSRIMEAVYGVARADMEDFLGLQDLQADLAERDAGDQILAIDLRGRDPDDVFSNVPYVKGQLFLELLEDRVGREKFDVFLRAYFDHFAFQSVSTEDFLAYLDATLLADPAAGVSKAEIREWVLEPGLPASAVLPESNAFERVAAASRDWQIGEITAAELPTSAWTVHEWLYFLNNLPQQITPEQLAELDSTFGLTATSNNEVTHSWLKIAIRNNYQPAYDRLRTYLVHIGRRKLITPLYKELMKSESGRAVAREIYARARPGYHPLAVNTMDEIVGVPE